MSGWEWNDYTKTYDYQTAGTAAVSGGVKCHSGNTAIYTNGGTLFIGGWSNAASVTNNMHVIDLTGLEHKWYDIPTAYDKQSEAFLQYTSPVKGWLSLPFPDYGVPTNLNTKKQWQGIANEILKILKKGVDVLVCCTGGHGRSGMFMAIVGNLLHKGRNGWEHPVEKVRSLHCQNAVETSAQEEYVYKILGLSLPLSKTYVSKVSSFQKCGICGTQSIYVEECGMCVTCKNKFAPLAPVRYDLTVEDIEHPIEHTCDEGENCIGIYRAEKCGHTVHNMIVAEGLCEICSWKAAHPTTEPAETKEEIPAGAAKSDNLYAECAICHRSSYFGRLYGVCWDCSDELKQMGKVDYVHNSITDPYRAVVHTCKSDVHCVGIMAADVCKHVVHDREVIDGLCSACHADLTANQEIPVVPASHLM